MPEDYEIKAFLKNHMAEVIDMMLAEEQELNALDLIARANEKKGIKKGTEQSIDSIIENMLAAGIFTDEQISIATKKDIDYIRKIKEKMG